MDIPDIYSDIALATLIGKEGVQWFKNYLTNKDKDSHEKNQSEQINEALKKIAVLEETQKSIKETQERVIEKVLK